MASTAEWQTMTCLVDESEVETRCWKAGGSLEHLEEARLRLVEVTRVQVSSGRVERELGMGGVHPVLAQV